MASIAVSDLTAATLTSENPFSINKLPGGYMQLAAGEGYGNEKSGKEGKCGEDGKKKIDKEGKCGEGKCGSKGDMKKNMGSSDANEQPETGGK